MSGLSASRIERLVDRCDHILGRLGNTVSERVCEDTEQLERLHDFLAREVENLTNLMRELLVVLAGDEQ